LKSLSKSLPQPSQPLQGPSFLIDTLQNSAEAEKVYGVGRILIIENGDHFPGRASTILSVHHYEAESAKNVQHALERLVEQSFDLVLVDLSLPEMNGLQLLYRINEVHGDVPAVMMADSGSLQRAVLSLKLGAQGFVVKPFTSRELLAAVETALQKNRRVKQREEMKLLETLEVIRFDLIKALSQAIQVKDHYTGDHCDRIVEYSGSIAEKFGLSPMEKKVLAYAAALHDIGKIGIPESILNKPGRLTEEEYTVMKTHPEKGAAIIQGVGFLAPVVPLIYHHQERYDGLGYPDGLAGANIPLGSRIVAVLDTFDAMTSDRPYRKALPVERAVAELKRFTHQQFDPHVVDAFLQVLEEASAPSCQSDHQSQ
jgi:putative two-component system response regulator